jgi:hypothetical protein
MGTKLWAGCELRFHFVKSVYTRTSYTRVKSIVESINVINMNEISKVRLKFNQKTCTKIFYNFVQLFKATGLVPDFSLNQDS